MSDNDNDLWRDDKIRLGEGYGYKVFLFIALVVYFFLLVWAALDSGTYSVSSLSDLN